MEPGDTRMQVEMAVPVPQANPYGTGTYLVKDASCVNIMPGDVEGYDACRPLLEIKQKVLEYVQSVVQ